MTDLRRLEELFQQAADLEPAAVQSTVIIPPKAAELDTAIKRARQIVDDFMIDSTESNFTTSVWQLRA